MPGHHSADGADFKCTACGHLVEDSPMRVASCIECGGAMEVVTGADQDDVDDYQVTIDEDACLALTGAAEQCGNGTDTDASRPDQGLCGVHADSDRAKVTDFGAPAWAGLRDDLVDLLRSERDAYALATISPDIEVVWERLTGLEDITIGDVEYSATRLPYLARELSGHPDLDVADHPLGYPNCIALQGRSAKNHSCPNGAYGTSLLCGMHQDTDIPGTLLDEGEPGPDLESITVDGDDYLLVEQRDEDLIVVDERESELRRLEDAAGAETHWTDQETTPDLPDDADTLVLVGCGDAKADEPRKAKNLYTSNYSGLKRRYAEEHGDEWAILSAKYGLLDPEAEIEPYDLSVDDVDVGEWGVAVAGDLPDVRDTEVVVLAGPDYAEEIEGTLFLYGADVETPTEGMKIGERMRWLSDQLDEDDQDERKGEDIKEKVGAANQPNQQADQGDDVAVDHGGYPFACYDCANRFEEQSDDEICPSCGGPVVGVVPMYGLALDGGDTCCHCGKPALWEAKQHVGDDVALCAGHAAGFTDSDLTMLVDVDRPEVEPDTTEAAATDGGDQEDDVDAPETGLDDGRDEVLRDHRRAVTTLEDTQGRLMELAKRAEDVDVKIGLSNTEEDVDDLVEVFKRTGTALEHAHEDLPVVHHDAVERIEVVDEPEAEPVAPAQLPKYLREGVEKQSSDRLRQLAEYALAMAAWKDAEAQRQLEERAEAAPDDDAPEEWDADAWDDVVDEARESGDVPAGKGTLTTKTIDGRDYFYLQWREGDSIKSQYVAPVVPADSDSNS